MYKENLKNKKGFTLVEALIAISILLVAVASPLSIVSQSVFAANVAKDQTTAFYLAAEAIEFVRNVRDTANLQGLSSDWINFGQGGALGTIPKVQSGDSLSLCDSTLDSSVKCMIDTVSNPKRIVPCIGPCPNLDLVVSGSNKSFTYAGGTSPSQFNRSIKIEELTMGANGIKAYRVLVQVDWRTFALDRTFTIEEYLMNWQ